MLADIKGPHLDFLGPQRPFTRLCLDLNYFSFYNPNLNPTHFPKHDSQSPNHQFSQRISYV